MDTLFGLPAHPLLVHAVVVIGPLAALLAIVFGIRPKWGFYVRWPMAVFAVTNVGAALLAVSAGEALKEERFGGQQAMLDAIRPHGEAGDQLETVAIIFGIVAVLALITISVESPLASGKGGFTSKVPPPVGLVVRVVLIAAAIWLIYQTAITGHLGAEATWG